MRSRGDRASGLVFGSGTLIYLDTPVAARLYAGTLDRISARASALLRASVLRIAPMVGLELEYLYEIERVTKPAPEVVLSLQQAIGLEIGDHPFDLVVEHAEHAERLDWTRDPFDRLIVAQACIEQDRLLPQDETTRDHYAHAIG